MEIVYIIHYRYYTLQIVSVVIYVCQHLVYRGQLYITRWQDIRQNVSIDLAICSHVPMNIVTLSASHM